MRADNAVSAVHIAFTSPSPSDLVTRDDADPCGQLLASGRGGFDLDLNVVVAVLGPPGAQRILPCLTAGVDPAVRSGLRRSARPV